MTTQKRITPAKRCTLSKSELARRTRSDRKLLILASFLDRLPEEKFHYAIWASGKITLDTVQDRSCGTTACAAGWATVIPEFQRDGLRLTRTQGRCPNILIPAFNSATWTEALSSFFSISSPEAAYLFNPGRYLLLDTAYPMGPPDTASAKEVAGHLRRFLETRARKEHRPSPVLDKKDFEKACSVPSRRTGRTPARTPTEIRLSQED